MHLSYAASSFLRCEYIHCFCVQNPLIFTLYGYVAGNLNLFIACNSTSFYLIEMAFSPEIIEFYLENYYQVFIFSFLNFLLNTKFGHHI